MHIPGVGSPSSLPRLLAQDEHAASSAFLESPAHES
jgi:hypothetical protein